MRKASFVLAALLLLAGCKAEFHAGASAGVTTSAELSGSGITFLVPEESASSDSSTTGGIHYKGDSVTASTDGKTLTVNGKDYGPLNTGDKVDLREAGKVLVNDEVREPVAPK
jgi:hypothetical protein